MNGDHTSLIFSLVQRSKFWVTLESSLQVGVFPGLHSVPILFNLYINATLKNSIATAMGHIHMLMITPLDFRLGSRNLSHSWCGEWKILWTQSIIVIERLQVSCPKLEAPVLKTRSLCFVEKEMVRQNTHRGFLNYFRNPLRNRTKIVLLQLSSRDLFVDYLW